MGQYSRSKMIRIIVDHLDETSTKKKEEGKILVAKKKKNRDFFQIGCESNRLIATG